MTSFEMKASSGTSVFISPDYINIFYRKSNDKSNYIYAAVGLLSRDCGYTIAIDVNDLISLTLLEYAAIAKINKNTVSILMDPEDNYYTINTINIDMK